MLDKTNETVGASRRAVLGAGSALIAAGAAALTAAKAEAQATASAPPPRPALGGGAPSGDLFPVVETRSGKVMGIANGDIKEFKGVPYGAPTGGANRYMPPKKPAPWTGVRECIGYGPISPQTPADLRGEYAHDDHVGPACRRRRHGRGLPAPQCLDAGRGRRRQARRCWSPSTAAAWPPAPATGPATTAPSSPASATWWW